MSVKGSVLDHPIEKQREYAALFGLSLEDWRGKMIESNKETDTFTANLNAIPFAWRTCRRKSVRPIWPFRPAWTTKRGQTRC